MSAEQTRRDLLRIAHRAMHQRGFVAVSVGQIVEEAGVTKGAFYHHFGSKTELGYAVVDELLAERVRAFERRISSHPDPVEALTRWLTSDPDADDLLLGCPVAKMALEVSNADPEFADRLHVVFGAWRRAIAAALMRGQRTGHVRRDADAGTAATFILAAYEGLVAMTTASGDPQFFASHREPLVAWISALRP